jgi:hypothetical protein
MLERPDIGLPGVNPIFISDIGLTLAISDILPGDKVRGREREDQSMIERLFYQNSIF